MQRDQYLFQVIQNPVEQLLLHRQMNLQLDFQLDLQLMTSGLAAIETFLNCV